LAQVADIYKQTAENISSLIQYKNTDLDNQTIIKRQFGKTAVDMITNFTPSEIESLSLVAWELSKVADGSKQIKDETSPAQHIQTLFDSSRSMKKHRGKLTRFTLLLNAQIVSQQEPKTISGRQIPFPPPQKQIRSLQAY
jgi:hypothetical protein